MFLYLSKSDICIIWSLILLSFPLSIFRGSRLIKNAAFLHNSRVIACLTKTLDSANTARHAPPLPVICD